MYAVGNSDVNEDTRGPKRPPVAPNAGKDFLSEQPGISLDDTALLGCLTLKLELEPTRFREHPK
jgi:hypothetical protein